MHLIGHCVMVTTNSMFEGTSMAPMRFLHGAAAVGAALLVASCAASGEDAPEGAAVPTGADDATLALAVQPKIPIEDEDLRQLASMSIPAGEDGILGSGCSADDAAPLPDGDYYGIIVGYSTSLLTVDIACVYGPETEQFAAFAEATDADAQSFAVVNDVTDERPMLMTQGTQVFLEELGWKPVDVDTAATALDPDTVGEHCCVWVRVEDGRVVALVEPVSTGTAVS